MCTAAGPMLHKAHGYDNIEDYNELVKKMIKGMKDSHSHTRFYWYAGQKLE